MRRPPPLRFGKAFARGHDCADVIARCGKADLLDKRLAIRFGGAGFPSQYVAAAGVVLREGVGERLIRAAVFGKRLVQVPCPRQRVGDRIQTVLVAKASDPFAVCPFPGCVGPHLHEAQFAGLSPDAGIEAALAPHDSLDQSEIHFVPAGGRVDDVIMPVLDVTLPKPEQRCRCHEADRRACADPLPLHSLCLMQNSGEVETKQHF